MGSKSGGNKQGCVVLGPSSYGENTVILVHLRFGKMISFHFNYKMEQAILKFHSLDALPRSRNSCGLVWILLSSSMCYPEPAPDLQNSSSKACANLVFEQHALATGDVRELGLNKNSFSPNRVRAISVTKGTVGSVRKLG